MSGDTACPAPMKLKIVPVSFTAIIPAMLSVNILDELNRSLERLLPRLLINHERGHYSMAED